MKKKTIIKIIWVFISVIVIGTFTMMPFLYAWRY